MAFGSKHLHSLIQAALDNNASDIHIREDEAPCFRIVGEMVPIRTKVFTRENMVDVIKLMTGADILVDDVNELDGSYSAENICRIRYNVFKFQKKFGVICRLIRDKIPTIKELKLPTILADIALAERGLILVTGATGSGKSTTLAAMINHINNERNCHIISIEDPVEYIHTQINSRISQREVGIDTKNYNIALRSALRQDPDVLLIGELRDLETISIALMAAETGHTVFATVHTTDAMKTIGRLISMFPEEEQQEARNRLADNLYSTISQRMLRSLDNKNVVALEIMITNPGVKDCISGKDDFGRLISIIKEGRGKSGNHSQSFDQHLMDLYKKKIISKDEALNAATSQSDFILNLEIE